MPAFRFLFLLPALFFATNERAGYAQNRPKKVENSRPKSHEIPSGSRTVLPFEMPRLREGEEPVEHTGFRLLYDENHEQARWVAYELSAGETEKSFERTNRFLPDPKVKTGSATDLDYKGSGFDRGHLAPASDMGWSALTMAESFYYSNMSPQSPSFNRGIWKKGEDQVRKWARENDTLYVVVGPVLEKGLPKIGPSGVSVPGKYFKVILDYTGIEKKGIAFLMKNEGSKKPLSSFAVPIDSIESVTGIDFFPTLTKAEEDSLERKVCLPCWSWNGLGGGSSKDRETQFPEPPLSLPPGFRQCEGKSPDGHPCPHFIRGKGRFCSEHRPR